MVKFVLMTDWHLALQTYKDEHELSIEGLARLADVSMGTARNWLSRIGPGPGPDQVARLEEAFPGLVRRMFHVKPKNAPNKKARKR